MSSTPIEEVYHMPLTGQAPLPAPGGKIPEAVTLDHKTQHTQQRVSIVDTAEGLNTQYDPEKYKQPSGKVE